MMNTTNIQSIIHEEVVQLLEKTKIELVTLMARYFHDCSKKYFSEDYKKYPLPKFKVRMNLKQAGTYSPGTNTITLNADFANDDFGIKSTVYHETIHYYQGFVVGFKRGQDHKGYFIDKMNEINKGEGTDLVTISTTYKKLNPNSSFKQFYVYVLDGGNTIYVSWSPTENFKYIETMNKIVQSSQNSYNNGFYFPTNNVTFKRFVRASNTQRLTMSPVNKSSKEYDELMDNLPKNKVYSFSQ